MGILDTFFTNSGNIIKGFKELRGIKTYTIAKDKDNNVVCWFYDMDGLGVQIIEEYCIATDIIMSELQIKKEDHKNKSEYIDSIVDKKICILDKKFVLFEDVKEIAELTNIKGYNGSNLKRTMNKFETE